MSRRGQIKKTADKLEKKLAKELGGKRVSRSGAGSGWKGDVETLNFLFDSKNTEKSTIQIKAADLIKIRQEAKEANRQGVLILTFLPDKHYFVIPQFDCDFESLEQIMLAKSQKTISKSNLSSMEKRSFKKGVIPSFLVEFEKMPLGTPRKYLIINEETFIEYFGE